MSGKDAYRENRGDELIKLLITESGDRLGCGGVNVGHRAILGHSGEVHGQSRKYKTLFQSAAANCSRRTLKDRGDMCGTTQGQGMF